MLRRALMVMVLALLLARPVAADPLLPLVAIEVLRACHLIHSVDHETRDGVLLQRAELTCGPAALATLLTYYLGDPCTEDEMARLAGTYERLGTTLLGLRDACRMRGYRAAGYRMSLQQVAVTLQRDGVPLLVHYREPVAHFVLVVAIDGDQVLVSDPAAGNVTVSVADFARRFSGAVLVVTPRGVVDRDRTTRRVAGFEARARTLDEANRALALPRP